MRDSLIILTFFAVGVVLGVTGVLPFDISQTDIAMYALYALIFVVGFSCCLCVLFSVRWRHRPCWD